MKLHLGPSERGWGGDGGGQSEWGWATVIVVPVNSNSENQLLNSADTSVHLYNKKKGSYFQ